MLSKLLLRSLAGFVAIWGLIVLLAWSARSLTIVHTYPDLVPMPLNTAVGFALLGCSILFAFHERLFLSKTLAVCVFALGAGTLAQQVLGLNWEVGKFMSAATPTGDPFKTHSMTPHTALQFILSSTSILLFTLHEGLRQRRNWLSAIVASVVVSLAIAALLCHAAGLTAEHPWARMIHMTVQGAVLFVSIGGLLIARILIRYEILRSEKALFIYPTITGILSLIVATGLWQAVNANSDELVIAKIDELLKERSQRIEGKWAEIYKDLDHMAKRWQVRRGTPLNEWRQDAQHFVADSDDVRQMLLVDATGKVKGSATDALNDQWPDDKGSLPTSVQLLLEAIRVAKMPYISSMSASESGASTLLLGFPLLVDETINGFLVAVIDTGNLLRPLSDLVPDRLSKLSFLRGDKDFFTHSSLESGKASRVLTRKFSLVLDQIVVRSEFTLNFQDLSNLSNTVVGAGLVFSLLIFLLTYFILQLHFAQESLQQANKQYALVVQGAGVGIWDWKDVTKPDLYWSPRFYELLGYSAQDIAASQGTFKQLYHADDNAEEILTANGHFLHNEVFEHEVRLRCKDGHFKWFRVTAVAAQGPDGMTSRMVGAIQDIDRRKAYEKQIEETTSTLVAANQELEQFAYVASHDLQAPLRHITAFIEALARKLDLTQDAEAKKWMDFITEAAAQMNRLISDLLILSRVRKGELDTEKVNLGGLIDNLIGMGIFADQPVDLRISPLPDVIGSSTLLRQLFQNLLQNAAKFRKPGDVLVLSLTSQEDKDFWRISVADNGIGIEEQYFERIFKIFQRLHPRGTYEGTGIGLSICKRVVELHGGKIEVESKCGVGTTFHVSLSKHFSA